MDCPTCLKSYPENSTECPHCASAAGQPETDLGAKSDSSDNGLDGWWDLEPDEVQFTPQRETGGSVGVDGPKRAFKLPSLATLPSDRPTPEAGESDDSWSSPPVQDDQAAHERTVEFRVASDSSSGLSPKKKISLSLDAPESPKQEEGPRQTWKSPWAPPKAEKPESKSYGRSSEIQEAPLHDSWSTGESSQEQKRGDSTWAAALKAAARESSGDDIPLKEYPIQRAERPRPRPVETVPEELPAHPKAEFETLQAPVAPEPQPEPIQLSIKPRKKKLGKAFFGLLTVFLGILAIVKLAPASYHYLANRVAVPNESRAPASQEAPKDDATIWLGSAQESLAAKDYELAVAQLERAVGFLKEDEDEKARLKKTQVLLATTYSKAGNYTDCARLWTELARTYPKLRKEGKAAAAAASRENRIIANKKIKAGEKAVKNKKYDQAIKDANQALDIYTVSQGQNSQIAQAHGVLGDAYRGKQNSRVAFSHYTDASKLDPQGRYRSELRQLRLPARPRTRKRARPKPVKKTKPRFVITTGVPQGKARR